MARMDAWVPPGEEGAKSASSPAAQPAARPDVLAAALPPRLPAPVPAHVAADVNAERGLSDADVQERLAAGLVNDISRAPTRTVAEIVKANVFTRFNAILGSLLLVILT